MSSVLISWWYHCSYTLFIYAKSTPAEDLDMSVCSLGLFFKSMQTVTIIPKCNSSFLPTIGFAVAPSGLIYAEDTCSQGSEVGPLTHFIRATEQLSHDSNSQAVLICNKSELLTQRWKVLYPITNPLSETLLVCLENIDKYKQRNKQELIQKLHHG